MAEEAKAETAEPSGESEGAEVKIQQPREKVLGGPPRRGPSSVLRVSQLLLRAIAAHKGLTLAALRKELGNAGYQVRRECCCRSGEAPKSDIKSTLIRVSGNASAGYFRVWKTRKPKRKLRRRRLEEGARSRRRSPARPRGPRKRRARGRATRNAGEALRRSARANSTAGRSRPRAKDQVCSRAKEETRAKVIEEERGRVLKEDRPTSREEPRPTEEKQDREKPVKRSSQRLTSVKTDSRAAHTGTCTKSESPRNAAGNP
ncbi:testis-specific H1 histone [Saccopteryx leptura]|uniref:testis-specific H1 histone n=1 Tax=Saccopteryx leptura TaxID=249018 RepID=UPI00339CA0DF